MKRNILVGVIVLLTMAVTGLALLAQNSVDDTGMPNDPRFSDRANACFTGGSLGGSCHSQVEWTCGWYLIRYEYGFIRSFPQECSSLPVTPATEDVHPTATPQTLPCDERCGEGTPDVTVPPATEDVHPTATPQTLPCDERCGEETTSTPEVTLPPTNTPRPPTATPQTLPCDEWCG